MERINTAAAHAVNALTPEEAERFDAIVRGDRYLQDHFDSFRRVSVELVEGLPDIVPAASPDIWERIVSETGIGADAHKDTAETNVVSIKKRPRSNLLMIVSVAAALVVGAIVGTNLSESTPSMRDIAVATASDPGATTILMTSPNGPEINTEVVLASDGTGYLLGESLPALSEDRTYQLWLIVDDQVISAGLLGSNPDVVSFRAEGNVVGMAISNEVAGGVVVSEVAPTTLWLQDA